MLATVLLGPAPATAIGVTVHLLNALRCRPPVRDLIGNLSNYASIPVAGSLLFEALGSSDLATRDGGSFVVLVFVVFMAMNVLNFGLLTIDINITNGMPFETAIRALYLPLLPMQVAIGLLTAGVAFVYFQVGLGSVGLLAVICLVFQYLLRTALDSAERKEQLEGRSRGARGSSGRSPHDRASDPVTAGQDDGSSLCRGRPLRT